MLQDQNSEELNSVCRGESRGKGKAVIRCFCMFMVDMQSSSLFDSV